MKYFIRLSYNGAPFSGWQIQKNAPSVQEELQKALAVLFKEEVEVVGAGRTDSCVNAINYIAHTQFSSKIPLNSPYKEKLLYKINAILPLQIKVHNIFEVPDKAHARFDAISRTYQYFIHLTPDPFNSHFSFFIKSGKLDFEAMNKGAEYFIGRRDFSSLEKIGSDNSTSICTVKEAFWEKCEQTIPFNSIDNNSHYVFTVTADRFLRNMVRAMVGSLLEVGEGKKKPEWIAEMLEKRDRSAGGCSVPGNALFLTNIKYPFTTF